MELAISRTDTGIKVYVEGLSWKTVAEQLKDEAFSIFLFSIHINGKFTAYDDRVRVNDNQLSFCKQHLTMKELLTYLAELGDEEPYEVRLGNGQFFLESIFPDAWVVTFQQKEDAWGFLTGIQEGLNELINPILTSGLPTVSPSLTDDFSSVPNFERFLDKRYNRWERMVVGKFEQDVKNGKVSCPHCKR